MGLKKADKQGKSDRQCKGEVVRRDGSSGLRGRSRLQRQNQRMALALTSLGPWHREA